MFSSEILVYLVGLRMNPDYLDADRRRDDHKTCLQSYGALSSGVSTSFWQEIVFEHLSIIAGSCWKNRHVFRKQPAYCGDTSS